MNILSNICNPKQQHFEQEARTETYKPLSDYIFQNRSMQKMRAKYQKAKSSQEFKYQSWNHPYSISNFFMHQKAQNGHHNNQQPMYAVDQNVSNMGNDIMWRNDGHNSKKISFKDMNMPFCGTNKQQEQYQKQFKDRDQFYASMKATYPTYSFKTYNQQQSNQQQQILQQRENNLNVTGQSYSHSLLGKEVIQLKQENKELRRVIQEEYKPMRELYNKLLSEQQQREYLISKLEWKVKQLVKQMGPNNNKNNNNNFGLYQQGQPTTKQYKKQQQANMQLTKPKPVQYLTQKQPVLTNNYSTYQPLNFDKGPIHNNYQQHHLSNYTDISTYFPQNQIQKAPLNQYEPHNISAIGFAQNNNYQFNGHIPSSYNPNPQPNNNLSKSSYFIDNNTQSKYIPFQNNQPQNGISKNYQQFSQNIPSQQIYYQNASQNYNFQIPKNY